MSMTKNRRAVYKRGWWRRESNVDRKMRRKEMNKRVRHTDCIGNGNAYRKVTNHFKTMS